MRISTVWTRATSHRITWAEAAASAPDVVIVAPCGFGLAAAGELAQPIAERFPGTPVHAVDADGCFTRPGPRLVDGVETLARLLHPGAAR